MSDSVVKRPESAVRASELAREIVSESPESAGERWEAIRVRREPSRWVRGTVGGLAGVCLVLTLLNMTGRMPLRTAPAELSGANLEAHARRTVEFASRAIDAYRTQHEALPSSLGAVGAGVSSQWTYMVTGDASYWIRYEVAGATMSYDSIEKRFDFEDDTRRKN